MTFVLEVCFCIFGWQSFLFLRQLVSWTSIDFWFVHRLCNSGGSAAIVRCHGSVQVHIYPFRDIDCCQLHILRGPWVFINVALKLAEQMKMWKISWLYWTFLFMHTKLVAELYFIHYLKNVLRSNWNLKVYKYLFLEIFGSKIFYAVTLNIKWALFLLMLMHG